MPTTRLVLAEMGLLRMPLATTAATAFIVLCSGCGMPETPHAVGALDDDSCLQCHQEGEYGAPSIDHGAGIVIGGGYRISRLEARVHWIMLGLPDPVKQKAIMFGLQWLLPL